MREPPLNQTWMTIQQAAAYLGVTPITIRRRISAGQLEARRLKGGTSIRLRASDVEALLQPITAARKLRPR